MFAAVALSMLFCGAASAQAMRPTADGAQALAPAKIVQNVKIDQNLGAQVPTDLTFRDEQGRTVKLADVFAKGKPVLISLVYFKCPGLCTMTLSGMSRSFKPLEFTPGKEFEVITVSFDPSEGPQLAAEKKANYLKEYGRPEAAEGWHYWTGDKKNIDALCEAVGFHYAYDDQTKQYAHATALMLATPKGVLSRYFYGMEYSARDLRLGIVEASENKIGSLNDSVQLLCFQYDPHTGKYSFTILRVLKIFGTVVMVALASFLVLMFRRERRLSRAVAEAERAGAAPPDMHDLTANGGDRKGKT
jgi:protein SCO1/2